MRSREIVCGLKNFQVCFLNGGEMVQGFSLPPDVEVINLPPIKSDAAFKDIFAADGAPNIETIKATRTAQILAAYEQFQPDILVIELFPFGRRKFAFELLPLLERIKNTNRKTKVVCSLRDILVSKRDQARFENQVIETVNNYFDLLLIHSDPRFQRLEETFPSANRIKCEIRYTGFVAEQVATNSAADIVVSIGGGRVGSELLECAIAASDLLQEKYSHRMRLFTGPYIADEQFSQLQTQASARIEIERYTTSFVAQLAKADLSISMAGYNTCMNILATGVPAIVYPFTGNDNEEQTIRAEKLARLGLLDVIYPRELSPEKLAAKIVNRLRTSQSFAPPLDLDGVRNTANLLTAMSNNAELIKVAA